MKTAKETAVFHMAMPWPPTANTYYRRVGHKTLISARGREYRKAVGLHLAAAHARPLSGRLSVTADAYPPDRRERDMDNLWKALLDSLQHGGLFVSDGQIDELTIRRGDVCKGGLVVVTVREIG